MAAIIGLVAVALIAFIVMGMYNNLVRMRNLMKNSFSQIDVQLKRRYDLIPNLVETAKSYMSHEKNTLEAVIQARNQASSAANSAAGNPGNVESMKQLMGAENNLVGALSKLMMVVEQYPDLKANTTMNQLMEELTSTENKISFSRQAYNDSVMVYNNAREEFPSNVIANFFSFQAAAPFEITRSEEKETVKVSFT